MASAKPNPPKPRRPLPDRVAAVRAKLPADPDERAKALRRGTATAGKVRLV